MSYVIAVLHEDFPLWLTENDLVYADDEINEKTPCWGISGEGTTPAGEIRIFKTKKAAKKAAKLFKKSMGTHKKNYQVKLAKLN
jgi:hypothetical protein